MAKEYIERKAVINRLQTVSMPDDPYSKGIQHGVVHSVAVINEIPAANVVEVVRCEDCKSRHDSCFAGVGNTYCDVHHKYFPLDGFCSYGERRGNDAAD